MVFGVGHFIYSLTFYLFYLGRIKWGLVGGGVYTGSYFHNFHVSFFSSGEMQVVALLVL